MAHQSVEEQEEEAEEEFLFFWGHSKTSGYKAVFSNWYPAAFKDSDGVVYSSTEQYMMYKVASFYNGFYWL